MARKSTGRSQQRTLPLSWISPKGKGKEQRTAASKRASDDQEVIVIDSSSDEGAPATYNHTSPLPSKSSQRPLASSSSNKIVRLQLAVFHFDSRALPGKGKSKR